LAFSFTLLAGQLRADPPLRLHVDLASPAANPCVTSGSVYFDHYECTSQSHHTVERDSGSSLDTDVWSTRITGRFGAGPTLFDVTINSSIGPNFDDAVQQAFQGAHLAIVAAAGTSSPVSDPILLSSSAQAVTGHYLSTFTRITPVISVLTAASLPAPATETVCVGDLGEVPEQPSSLPNGPCSPNAVPLTLRGYEVVKLFGGPFTAWIPYDDVRSTHTHSLREIYPNVYVTGTLTISHYEVVAEGTSTTLVVPIVLSSADSAFSSELTLTNRGNADAAVYYTYEPAFGGSAGTVTDTLPAERQRVVPDAVAFLEGLGIANPGTGGTLRITFDGLSSPDAAFAIARTTTAVPGGRVGLGYAGLPSSRLLTSPVYLCGLRQNATDRSNVAVLNAGAATDGNVTLRLTVFSGDPLEPQSKVLPDIALSPGGFFQISGILVSNGLSIADGFVKVERVAGTAPFYAYGVINDEVTSDGSFIEPVAASLASPIASMTLPVLVETAAYASELTLSNFSSMPHLLHFTWEAAGLTGGRAAFSISLLPGEQQILPAFVQVLRGRGAVTDGPGPSFAGALFVSDDSGDLRGVSIGVRVTAAAEGGHTGVFVPAYTSGTEARTSAWLFGLRQDAETRSNLAIVNTGNTDASPSVFRIDLYDGDTGESTGSLVATVPAQGFAQIDRVLATYAPGTSNGCALVTKISGGNTFIAYAIVNDGAEAGQRSGDGVFVAASIPSP